MTWILPRQLHTLASALDTAALSLDLNEQSQVCAQSLFVRSKPSPSAIWLRKWKRDSWTQHLSGRILRPSLGQRFATEWTSSLGATHVSPSVQPGNAEARTTQGTCGPTSQTAFDFSDPGAASLRTSKDISAWGCPTLLKTWQEWVTERRGAYSARLNAERHTSENGYSSWPSPVASEVRQGFQDRSRGKKGSQESLTTVVVKQHGPADPASSNTDGSRRESWATPRANKTEGYSSPEFRPTLHQQIQSWQTATVSTGAHRQKDGSMTDKLDQQVKNWATPDVSDRRSDNCRQIGLSNQIKTWPTPASSGVTGGPTGLAGGAGNREKLAKMLPDAEARAMGCGKLNPRWVETLMGLPVGWTMPSCASPVTIERTNSDCSGMESCLQQPKQHLER